MANLINIDAVSAFDLGINAAMSDKQKTDVSIQWAVEQVATFWASSVPSRKEKLDYLFSLVSEGSLRGLVQIKVLHLNEEAYRSVHPVAEYV